MKENRATWAFVVFAAALLGAIYYWRNHDAATPPAPVATQPASPTAPANATLSPPTVVASGVAVQPVPMVRAGRNGEPVPVQDGKTIDMSSGRAVVRDDARSRAAIEQGVKEMEDAAANVTFGPRPAAPPAEKKKAEPPPAPPKS